MRKAVPDSGAEIEKRERIASKLVSYESYDTILMKVHTQLNAHGDTMAGRM